MNAVFIQEIKNVHVKKKTKALKKIKNVIISEDEEYNMTDCGSEEEEDPINTSFAAYSVKTEVDKMSLDDFDDYEKDSDENEETIGKPKRSKSRKCRIRKSSSNKKSGKAKKPKRFSCTKSCKQNCKTNIDKQRRQDLCTEFWDLNRVERKNYITKFVEKRPVLRLRSKSRGYSNRYFLKTSGDEKIRVCMGFFISTLSISGYFVKSAMENSDFKDGSIEQKSSCGNEEKLDYPQEEVVSNNDTEKEGDSNTERQSDVEKQITPESSTSTNLENQKEVNAATIELQQLSPRKSIRYLTKSKRIKRERLPKPVKCDEVCQMKCTRHFSEEQRAQICATYWSMDFKRRKDFLISRVEVRDVLTTKNQIYRKGNRAKRTHSNRFYFRGGRGENVRVCLNFLISTLCIGRRSIEHAIKNADPVTGSYVGEDKRGRRTPPVKIPEDRLNEVKRHIESYPTWVPHKNYKTRFLHSSLNIRKMYREYKQICVEQQRKFVSDRYFGNVFHKDYRLAFLKPTTKHAQKVNPKKKDSSGNALTFKKLNPNISEFTGEEGGFWIPAEANVRTVELIKNQQQQQQQLESTQLNVTTYDVHRINIQQNLQLQVPHYVQQAPVVNTENATNYLTSRNFLQQHGGTQDSLQNDTQNVILSFTNSAYVQESSFISDI